jgi:hypothetical protein
MGMASVVIVFAAFFARFVRFVGGARCWLLGVGRFVWAHRVVSERLEDSRRAMSYDEICQEKKKETKNNTSIGRSIFRSFKITHF